MAERAGDFFITLEDLISTTRILIDIATNSCTRQERVIKYAEVNTRVAHWNWMGNKFGLAKIAAQFSTVPELYPDIVFSMNYDSTAWNVKIN